jgi:methionine-gamma-lyase
LSDEKKPGAATVAIHAGQEPDPSTGALIPPVHLSATYIFTGDKLDRFMAGDEDMYTYGRTANPTQDQFEEKIARVEGGEAALATASGMAAISNAIMSFAGSGDHVIYARSIYSGTYYTIRNLFARMGIQDTLLASMDNDSLDAACQANTRVLYFETISNPNLRVADADRLTAWAKKRGLLTIVDNTFMSPYLFKPLAHGADLVAQSTTKYINGHGDQLGGVIVGSKDLIDTVHSLVYQNLGAVPSPVNCYLGMRGMKTLPLRMEKHCENAMCLARAMERNPRVVRVDYPGLESHPDHTLAKTLFPRGFGGMVAITVDGGLRLARQTAQNLRLARYCASLGDLETIVETPANITHGKIPPEIRREMGVTDGMIRVSVGCESAEDIIADFEQAIAAL